jgi:hypothetical protein
MGNTPYQDEALVHMSEKVMLAFKLSTWKSSGQMDMIKGTFEPILKYRLVTRSESISIGW